MGASVRIEVSPGELVDKLTILEIKRERIAEPEKRANVEAEYALLCAALNAELAAATRSPLDPLRAELKRVNARLWDIEDEIRDCDRRGDFGPPFVDLARSVYRTNDRRSELKRAINALLGSKLIEEKSYRPY